MRKSVRALIIKNKKLLLVTGQGVDFYWTPGGGIEAGETANEALKRELMEELGLALVSATPYDTQEISKDKESRLYFLVQTVGEISVDNDEVSKIIWCSREDFESKKYTFSSWASEHVAPQLIKEGLL